MRRKPPGDGFGGPRDRDPRVDEIHDAMRALGRDPDAPTDAQRRASEALDADLAKYGLEYDAMTAEKRQKWLSDYAAAERKARGGDAAIPTDPDRLRSIYTFDRFAIREEQRREKRAKAAAVVAESLAEQAERAAKRAAKRPARPVEPPVAPTVTDGPSVEIKPGTQPPPRRRKGDYVQLPDGTWAEAIRDEDDF